MTILFRIVFIIQIVSILLLFGFSCLFPNKLFGLNEIGRKSLQSILDDITLFINVKQKYFQ